MHKLTLMVYLITSLLMNHSIKSDQKFSLWVLIGNSYSPSSFNISQRNVSPIIPK